MTEPDLKTTLREFQEYLEGVSYKIIRPIQQVRYARFCPFCRQARGKIGKSLSTVELDKLKDRIETILEKSGKLVPVNATSSPERKCRDRSGIG
jgi:hypothetical protein